MAHPAGYCAPALGCCAGAACLTVASQHALCLPVCRRRVIPYAVADFFPIYVAINVLLCGLYAMQLMWMRSIIRVLRWGPSAAAPGGQCCLGLPAILGGGL
jgi:hypothetical protein